jgi:hypothetical protein
MIEHLDFIGRLFIFVGLMVVISFLPKLWEDIKEDYQYLKEQLKRPAAGTADQEKTSNYNISEFRNINNLERWR